MSAQVAELGIDRRRRVSFAVCRCHASGRAGRRRAKTIDEAMFHASGGGALTSEILRHAERGRRADFDSAHMFLARYHVKGGARPISKVSPRSVCPGFTRACRGGTGTGGCARATAGSPNPRLSPLLPNRRWNPLLPNRRRSLSRHRRPSRLQRRPAPVAPALPALPKVGNVELFLDSVKYLKRRGDALGEAAKEMGEGQVKPLVEQCVDAVEHLVDLFSQDETGCEATDAFIDELSEASDMMVLMQVEEGDAPAADAVTLLLQNCGAIMENAACRLRRRDLRNTQLAAPDPRQHASPKTTTIDRKCATKRPC